MYKRTLLLLLVICLSGCAVLSQGGGYNGSSGAPLPTKTEANAATGTNIRQALKKETGLEKPIKPGLVFGKTDFKGLLKAAYVRLTIVPLGHAEKKYYYYVGSKENLSVLPWSEGKLIEPGYFYLHLPPGKYEILNLAIPVGSTIAEEAVALSFEVSSGSVYYLGTLDVEGTKDRVKFGGVPLLKPGFEYKLSIHDDFEAAKKDFETILPLHQPGLKKNLLIVASGLRAVDARQHDKSIRYR